MSVFCSKCGAKLKEGSGFCAECGAPVAARKKPVKKNREAIIVAVCIVIGAVILLALSGTNDPEKTVPVSNDTKDYASVSTNYAPDPEISELAEPEISEEDYKSACSEVSYADLCRYPEDHIGEKIVLKVKVSQVIDVGFFSSKQAWRAYTDNDGYGFYFDDEYYLADERGEGAVKILKDDILTVYGEFTGLEKVTRALTGTNEEIPCIAVRYAEIVGNN